MMKKIFIQSIAKREEFSAENEDYAAFSEERQRFALSDGATESFDSQLWAKLLVDSFINGEDISEDWLQQNIQHYFAQYKDKFSQMSWFQIEAFQKGSFATFLGLTVKESENEKILSFTIIGDSYPFIFQKDDQGIYQYIPLLDEVPNFKDRPLLLSSKTEFNKNILSNPDYYYQKTFTKEDDIIVICATDALAELIFQQLEKYKADTNKICRVFIEKKFQHLITFWRRRKLLKIDDTTIAILKI